MIPDVPNVIGFKLENAKILLGSRQRITVEVTTTPFEDKKLERKDAQYVVVRQKVLGDEIILTVSQFK